jgi:putative addiction module component (TIGR02574 family)
MRASCKSTGLKVSPAEKGPWNLELGDLEAWLSIKPSATLTPMSKVQLLEQVIEQIKELPRAERAELAEKILRSLDELSQAEYDQIWAAEIESRHQDLKSGKVKVLPREEVMRDVESRLK